jgi:hypothetical protein
MHVLLAPGLVVQKPELQYLRRYFEEGKLFLLFDVICGRLFASII